LEDPLLVEVALGRPPWPNQVRLVRGRGMERVAVGLGVDRDRGDSELAQRPEDANGDLTTVGDEHLGERRHRRRIVDYSCSLPRAPGAPSDGSTTSVASLSPARRQALRYCGGSARSGPASRRSSPAISASLSSPRGAGVILTS